MSEDLASVWFRATAAFNRNVVEAQRATLEAFGLVDGQRSTAADGAAPADDEMQSGADERSDIDQGSAEWEWDRTVETTDDLTVGDRVTFSKRVTDDDVERFAAASGDTNRLHLDDEFAVETRFDGRIVHGTLVASLISAALARLPGLTIYLSQDVRFLRPVSPGERLTAVVEVVELLGDDRYRLSTLVRDENDETVIEGEAVVLIDDLPDGESTVTDRASAGR